MKCTLFTASIGTFSLSLYNYCFENVFDDASCCRCTHILNETKEKILKLLCLSLVVRVVVSNDIRTPGTPGSRDGKGAWSCKK